MLATSSAGAVGVFMFSAIAGGSVNTAAQEHLHAVDSANSERAMVAQQSPLLEEQSNYPEALEGLNYKGAEGWGFEETEEPVAAFDGVGGAAFGVEPLAGGELVGANAVEVQTLTDAQIVEALQPLNLEPIDLEEMVLYRTLRVRRGVTAATLLKRAELSDPAAQTFLSSDAKAKEGLFAGKRRKISIESNGLGQLTKMSTLWLDTDRHYKKLIVERKNGKLVSSIERRPVTVNMKEVGGTVRVALFQATDDAGLPDSVTDQLIDTFSSRIDFHRKLRKGDKFNLVHESFEAEGEVLGTGKMLAAEFVNGRRHYEAMWFKQKGMPGGYYTLDGNSLKKAFLASPLKFTRITSLFGNRRHPISGKWKKHNGMDYAAPTGTPIMSLGDGVVKFAGWQRGYGNCVEVAHRGGRSTFYAHMSKLKVKKGQTIQQKDIVGLVGSTGWSTGPHLHLEYRLNGAYKDPKILVKDGGGSLPVEQKYMAEFKRQAEKMRVALKKSEKTRLALR